MVVILSSASFFLASQATALVGRDPGICGHYSQGYGSHTRSFRMLSVSSSISFFGDLAVIARGHHHHYHHHCRCLDNPQYHVQVYLRYPIYSRYTRNVGP